MTFDFRGLRYFSSADDATAGYFLPRVSEASEHKDKIIDTALTFFRHPSRGPVTNNRYYQP